MNEEEAQANVDGEKVFFLPLKMLIALDGKPAGFASKFSDMYGHKRDKTKINLLF